MANYSNNILFDVLKNVLSLKSIDLYEKHVSMEDFDKQFSRYMILRYLSMAKSEIAKIVLENQISFERFPSNKQLYKLLLNIVPKQKSGFIKYIK